MLVNFHFSPVNLSFVMGEPQLKILEELRENYLPHTQIGFLGEFR